MIDALAPLSNKILTYVEFLSGSRFASRLLSAYAVLFLLVRADGSKRPKAMGTRSSGRGFLFLLVFWWLARRERRDSY